ncbi:ATP-dependent DNA helicase UvrD2 [Enteractinococcus coprophilus]|uniref:DNA 3'-5' helicase n=1 Tax=Enteractinococcus coprophilus TaxID=1027633 RepID=A0A543A0B3_9MICC|nr:ATP-dependent DNA helicase UvrD2 [Enteractinococcus coprophilus]TQL65930.1 Rep family ATP-dependent DNA helicase [Enteractinococcus coprophilus]
MQNPEEILAGLDAEQRQAATALRGPVRILAGAGTGKTRAITHRIAYGVATGVYNPYNVLAVTFTARAAAEMRSRLRDLGAHGVQARTFHAAALSQLQYFWQHAVGGDMPRLVEHKTHLIMEAAQRLRMSTDKATIRDLAGEIEWAKFNMLTPQTYHQQATQRTMPAGWDLIATTRLFQAYEDLKSDRGLIDFEDVLLIMVGILESEPRIAATVRKQYRIFLVDEFQDVSPLQYRLLKAWLGDRDDLCVVGDTSQTIYSFTGATADYLLDFGQEFPDATQIKLIRDYRSTPQIVDLANRLLLERTKAHRSGMPRWPEPLELISQRESGAAPVFAECTHEQAEAEWVTAQIQQLLSAGHKGSDIAILFRTNAQSAIFEQALSDAGVSYQVRGAERFFNRREVRDGILQLRAAAKSAEGVAGSDVVTRIKDVLASLGYTPVAPEQSGAVRERWESLNAIVNLAEDLVEARGDQVTLDVVVAELDERASHQHAPVMDGVTLASIHSAKGLEWDAVFLVGLTEGLMPISFATEDKSVDEERRLFYVGITRAKTRLYLSWSLSRSAGGRANRRPSRFLQAIRATTVQQSSQGSSQRGRRAKGTKVAKCRTCGAVLSTGAERKIGRCQDCPPTYDPEVFDKLVSWRKTVSTADKVPAFVIFTDATLVAIAEKMPTDLQQLRQLPGIGPKKLERYGTDVLAILGS